jgi:hypothetical protein
VPRERQARLVERARAERPAILLLILGWHPRLTPI